MSDGCPGCFSSVKGQQIEYSKVKKAAEDYAKEKAKPVAIYQEQGEWCFIEAEAAYRLGYPVKETVSTYQ